VVIRISATRENTVPTSATYDLLPPVGDACGEPVVSRRPTGQVPVTAANDVSGNGSKGYPDRPTPPAVAQIHRGACRSMRRKLRSERCRSGQLWIFPRGGTQERALRPSARGCLTGCGGERRRLQITHGWRTRSPDALYRVFGPALCSGVRSDGGWSKRGRARKPATSRG
jgi:hypothetical protein